MMPVQRYNWKRYWYSRVTSLYLVDGGFLSKPNVASISSSLSGVIPFEVISKTPCLVLLGEPGIGKSHEMEIQDTFTKSELAEATLRFDLGGYQSDFMLCQELFGNPVFQSWLNGTHLSIGRHNESCVKACRKQESLDARQAQLVHII